jgi:dipeptide/tripeptide permease
LADQLFGDYYTIIVGIFCFYLPGILLIALTTIPGLLVSPSRWMSRNSSSVDGDDHFMPLEEATTTSSSVSSFNGTALAFGLLVLWPTGTGIVKSVVNVFGAKQFHPLLQSSLIESYYVNFYMCINIGALIGGIVVPLLAQTNVTLAYFLPLLLLTIGMILFMFRSPRFVIAKPKRNDTTDRILQFLCYCCRCCSHKKRTSQRKTKSCTHLIPNNTSNDPIPISAIFRISLLVVPFNIVYSQMSTTFIVQGTVMKKTFYNLIDAACMNNADAIAVLFFGHVVGTILYPYLADQNIKIPTTYKFAIGSAFGALSILWALMVEYWIITTYEQSGERISILWQGMSYILIGAGEIFAVSAAYEVAFKASPPEQKVLFSAVNLFCIGGLPSVICIILYQLCVPWFQNSDGNMNISHIQDYATAHINKYFWLLLVLSIFGTLINLLPICRDFVENIEDRATDMIKTPKTPKFPPTAAARRKMDSYDTEESSSSIEEQLLASRRHQYYLKYGSGPSLYKHGSMRAGPALSFTNRNDKNSSRGNNPSQQSHRSSSHTRPTLNSQTLSRLYCSTPDNIISPPVVMSSSSGQPVTMANAALLLSPSSTMTQRKQHTTPTNGTTTNTAAATTGNEESVFGAIDSSNSDEVIV